MKLRRIFVNGETGEGLYAMQYPGQEVDEFERLFDLWNDVEYVQQFCMANQSFIASEYFNGVSTDSLEVQIIDEASELEIVLAAYCDGGFEGNGKTLEMLFRPLNNNEFLFPVRQETKAKLNDRNYFPRPLLRIYAIRLGKNTFVVTGGAIKLTRKMSEHPDTRKERNKLTLIKNFLKQAGISVEEDINYYYGNP